MNEFFQFKQHFYRQCSFQLSQLLFHAQRINEYFTLMKNVSTDGSRRSSNHHDDPVNRFFLCWDKTCRSFQLEAENIDKSIRDTNTLQNKNFRKWNWDLTLSLLKVPKSMRTKFDNVKRSILQDFPQLASRIHGDLCERFASRSKSIVEVEILFLSFLDKLFDFFKPEEPLGFRSVLLTDRLSDVTCRSLLALADLLVYPTRASSNHIRVANSPQHRRLSACCSSRPSPVTSCEISCRPSPTL